MENTYRHKPSNRKQCRGKEIDALIEGSRAVLTHKEFKDAARSIFDACKNLIGATSGYIALSSKDGTQNEAVFLETGGLICDVGTALPMPIRGMRSEAYRKGKAIYNNDYSKTGWSKFLPPGHIKIDTVLFAPMVIDGKVAGLMGLSGKQGGFTDEDARVASVFGELEAIALYNSRLLDSLKRSESELRKLNEDLEKRVGYKTGELSKSNELLRLEIERRKKAEESLRRSNRALKTLSECGQILVRSKNETALLENICTIIVDQGGYRMAWVGFAEQDEKKTVRPVAKAGFEEGYFESLAITWADTEKGRGPTGTAIRTGRHFIAKDIITDPYFTPWREEARKRGYASSIALPLISDSATFGSLNIYAAEPDAFDDEEVRLLLNLGDDLAYGIKSLRMKAEKERVEKELEKRLRQNKLLLEAAGGGIYGVDPEGNFTFFNQTAEKITGFKAEEVLGRNSHKFIHHSKPDGLVYPVEECPIHASLKSGSVLQNDNDVFWKKDGNSFPVEYITTPIIEEEGAIGAVVTFADITERKKAEEALKLQLERMSALRNIDMAISSSLNLRVTLSIFLDHVTTQLHVDAADILLLNPNTQILEYAAGRGFRTRAIEKTSLRLGQGIAGRTVLERQSISIKNITEAKDIPYALKGEGFKAYMSMPLIAKGHVKGVLELFHRSMIEPDSEWLGFFEILSGQAAIAIDNISMFDNLQHSNLELIMAYDTTIEGWSRALDFRDKETEGHSQRVTDMTLHVAKIMGISDFELVHIRRGALLHDIGKLGVPDSILLKPDKLNEEEWKIMKMHPQIAHELLSPITFLKPALDIPYCHHEKWNGAGYPRGFKGDEIPFAARIFAVVDVWDALRSDRPYRQAWSLDRTKEYIHSLSGIEFDPVVVEMFMKQI